MSKLIKSDQTYRNWIDDVSERFRRCQIRASMKVSDEMLRFYWSVGRDISAMSADAKYGSGFYQTISNDLHSFFPEVHSFSVTNLRYMRYFYEMYPTAGNHPQAGDDLAEENHPRVEENLDFVFCIPWGHQKAIIDKCKGNPKKAVFYVKKTIENS